MRSSSLCTGVKNSSWTHWKAKATLQQCFFCFLYTDSTELYTVYTKFFTWMLDTGYIGYMGCIFLADFSCTWWKTVDFFTRLVTFFMTPSIRNEKSASSLLDLGRKSEKRNDNQRQNVNCLTTGKTFWTISWHCLFKNGSLGECQGRWKRRQYCLILCF